MNIIEWTEAFIKYKDTAFRRIDSLNVENDGVLVHNKDGSSVKWVCSGYLNDLNIDSLDNQRIVCYNMLKNVDWVLENWDNLKDSRVVFYFVNVDKSESWALNPKNHHLVSEKGSLKQGLYSLFESIGKVR
ncbi:hypothetical protein K9L97_03025 [Candidatus Woesearchaeota archaeon]|nr:hypothetical protein [Candidatus Woesearchaeota archaeon]